MPNAGVGRSWKFVAAISLALLYLSFGVVVLVKDTELNGPLAKSLGVSFVFLAFTGLVLTRGVLHRYSWGRYVFIAVLFFGMALIVNGAAGSLSVIFLGVGLGTLLLGRVCGRRITRESGHGSR
jgi:hypothetical protein